MEIYSTAVLLGNCIFGGTDGGGTFPLQSHGVRSGPRKVTYLDSCSPGAALEACNRKGFGLLVGAPGSEKKSERKDFPSEHEEELPDGQSCPAVEEAASECGGASFLGGF